MLILFLYLFAANALFSATAMVLVKNPMRCALLLIYCFFSMAAVWVLFSAAYLAFLLVLVYVGAVMVLFVFVLMLVSLKEPKLSIQYKPHVWLAILMLLILGVQIAAMLIGLPSAGVPLQTHTFTNLGLLMFTHYAIEVEIAALLLLCAMICAIVFNLKKQKRSLKQSVYKQNNACASQRLTLVDVPVELNKKQDKR